MSADSRNQNFSDSVRKSTRTVGSEKEEAAVRFLVRKGCNILARNFRVRSGEIDVIYLDGDTVCFGEVKYRTSENKGRAEQAVNYRKQYRICRVSDHFRAVNALGEELSYRFDVLSVGEASTGEDRIRWIRNAFPYISK